MCVRLHLKEREVKAGRTVTPALVSSLCTCFQIISTVCFNSSELLQRLFHIHFGGIFYSDIPPIFYSAGRFKFALYSD